MDISRTRRETEVWQACDDLHARAIPFYKMTIDAITERLLELGCKKGSPNQIYQYRNSWKSHGRDDA